MSEFLGHKSNLASTATRGIRVVEAGFQKPKTTEPAMNQKKIRDPLVNIMVLVHVRQLSRAAFKFTHL